MDNKIVNPEKEKLDYLINLYNEGDIVNLINESKSFLKKYPDSFILWNILGIAFSLDKNTQKKALEAYKKCILLKPDFADVYNNLGVVLQNQGSQDEALKNYKKAISLKPNYADAYNNIGAIYKDQGKLNESAEAYQKSISINPNNSITYYNLGNILKEQEKNDHAIEMYNKSISLNPNLAQVYNNMGNIFKDQGEFKEAINLFKKSILIKPAYAEAHHNLSISLLNDGKTMEGLEEYEWRFKTEKSSSLQRNFFQPQWDGKINLKDKRILIWCEQGIGDTLNWSSRLPLLAFKAKKCILECQEKLVPLLKRSFPDIEVKPENKYFDTKRNDFDFQLPMGSLYKHFLTEIKKSPKVAPYLIPDPNRVKYWKKRLTSLGKGPYVGICWKSSVVSNYRFKHYPSILEWSPILTIPEVTFINLQYIDFENDLNDIKNTFGVKVHNFEDLDQFNNIDDLTALSAALDFVVSTKTTPPIISSGVGTDTKIANWKQSNFNNILLNPVSSSVDIISRNTWEPWDNVFNLIAKEIFKIKNKNKYYKDH